MVLNKDFKLRFYAIDAPENLKVKSFIRSDCPMYNSERCMLGHSWNIKHVIPYCISITIILRQPTEAS